MKYLLIYSLLLTGCGRIDTSGTQTVTAPNTTHKVTMEYSLDNIYKHFYSYCAYQIYSGNLEIAGKVANNATGIVPEVQQCAYDHMEQFLETQNTLEGIKNGLQDEDSK